VLLRHDDTPGVILPAILDVDEPVLKAQGDGAALATLTGGDLDVAPAVVDLRDRADEVLERA
jgi:hypothetical protein